VQYEVAVTDGTKRITGFRLPENYNGLGYQNLISMLFTLMSFRDEWMRVGKADVDDTESGEASPIPPMHLVLLEEPEAHLHVQVQQVFVRKAYEVLIKHPKLTGKTPFSTQLLVSTHSSHVAHELPFKCLRYFRRLPSGKAHGAPVTAVENLSDMYGSKQETHDFVTRYLKSSHFDVFFADAVVCIEGQAERMLLPLFIRSHFRDLDHRYLSVLELGGSHAHRLRPLLERLGIIILIITDLDAKEGTTNKSVIPATGAGQESRNTTLRDWIPKHKSIDALMKCTLAERTQEPVDGFSVRVAYQMPQSVTLANKITDIVLANTFEDAFIFANLELLTRIGDQHGIASRISSVIKIATSVKDLATQVNAIVETMRKAEFALDVLTIDDLQKMAPPPYIVEGLTWLQEQVRSRSVDSLIVSTPKDGASNGKR
jgi:predicted ATP-dependent endonuclease of OLD family